MSPSNGTLPDPEPWITQGSHGSIITGWLGMATFLLATLGLALLRRSGYVPTRASAYALSTQAFALACVYMLCAQEQFIIMRHDNVHVNVLLAVAAACVWVASVVGTGMRVWTMHSAEARQYTWILAAFSQALLVAGAVSWNSVRFGCYTIALALIVCVFAHFVSPALRGEGPDDFGPARVRWLCGAALLTLMHMVFTLLSHSFVGTLSLAGAIAAFVVVHALALLFQLYVYRTTGLPPRVQQTQQPQMAVVVYDDPLHVLDDPQPE